MTKITIGKPLVPPKNFFRWCENQLPVYVWKNNEQTILSSERKNRLLIEKKLRKNSNLSIPTRFYSFAIVLVSKNRIEIQSHDYWLEVRKGKEILTSRMANFERFEKGTHTKASYWNGDWHKGLLPNYGYMSGAYTNTIFYPNEWEKKLYRNKDMKYLELPHLSRYELPRVYKYRNQIEHLQKINATTLANQVLSYEVDCRVMTKKWLKKKKSVLKNSNLTFNELMLQDIFKKKKIKMVKGIEKLLDYKQLKTLPGEVNLNKFQRYFIKQKVLFSHYMDYLNMIKELDIPLNDDVIVFPTELNKAHDNAVNTLNKLKKEVEEQAYNDRRLNLVKLEKEIDDYIFLVPKELQEIVQEGNSLHHCVGSNSYLDQHIKGQTTIIFIRKKDDVETPYFTMEYKKKKIVQIQGKYNRETVPSTVQKAIKKWKKEVESR